MTKHRPLHSINGGMKGQAALITLPRTVRLHCSRARVCLRVRVCALDLLWHHTVSEQTNLLFPLAAYLPAWHCSADPSEHPCVPLSGDQHSGWLELHTHWPLVLGHVRHMEVNRLLCRLLTPDAWHSHSRQEVDGSCGQDDGHATMS